MTDLIKIEHLQKHFGDVFAVNDISFKVRKGELFAFLGVNGAGKSTTINIICGQLKRDGGSVEICGTDIERDPDKVKRSLGVVFQSSVLDKELSVRDNLESRAALYGITGAAFRKRAEELAELLANETYRIAKPCFDAFGYGLGKQVIYAKRLEWLQQPAEGE